jgi:hypothetical protein
VEVESYGPVDNTYVADFIGAHIANKAQNQPSLADVRQSPLVVTVNLFGYARELFSAI